MVREPDAELQDAIRTAADILETIGPNGLGAVLARVDRLEREGDRQGCRHWRRVARAMRSLAIHSATEHQPDLGCSRRLRWMFMQWVEACCHEADKREAQAQASADRTTGPGQSLASTPRPARAA